MVRSRLAHAKMLLALPLVSLPLLSWCQSEVAAPAPENSSAPKESIDPQDLKLRLDVRRVPVDVVVLDKEGNPVRGLKPEDFTVKEDSKPQTILSFDYLDGSVPHYIPPKLPPLPANTFINVPAEPERGPLYVLYYDMVNTEPADQMTFRREMMHFIDRAQPGTRIALFVNMAGLHLMQGFTSDHTLLRTALTAKGPGPHVPDVFIYGDNYGKQDVGATISNLQFLAEYMAGISGRKNLLWLSGKFPVPHGPVFRPISGDEVLDIQNKNPIKHAFAAMMRAQVAIYPIDVKGVVLWEERSPSPAGDAGSDFSTFGPSARGSAAGPAGSAGGGGAGGTGAAGGAGAGTNEDSGSATALQGQTAGLSGYSVTAIDQFQEDFIASSTGGHAYYGNNRISEVIEKAMASGESYYTLSYAPLNTKYDGSDRHIEVSLKGAKENGYRLTYRNLYYAVSDDAVQAMHKPDSPQARFIAAKEADTLFANIEHGAPMLHDLLFSAHLAADGSPKMASAEQMTQLEDSPIYFKTRKKNRAQKPLAPVRLQRYLIDYGVIDPQLKVAARSGGKKAALEFAAAAYDADGRLLNSILNEGLASGETQAGGKSGSLFHAVQELQVPPGAAWIRLAVRNEQDNRTGTLEVKLPLAPENNSSMASRSN